MSTTMNELKERMFLQQYLKNATKQNQCRYAHFLNRKLNGEELSINQLTEEDLKILYIKEGLVDKQIASLFGETNREIQKKREQWGIRKKLHQEITLVS
ncbi:hypothetical protein CVD28_03010 [Bacillus sp. M6-12]|uniref:hypothetical protein n=1 Tax=Bacillus sp. M6-12 TaxID=2054166 RepID=UPI000C780529|nr:hypothetical protein [Bacillus sp. M6-12]PLS19400.1 hypothetical protein CVD28_03010 [Bacillus sp. M6-12]